MPIVRRKKFMRSPAVGGLARRSPNLDFYWSMIRGDKNRFLPSDQVRGRFFRRARSILPVKPDQFALNLDPVRRQDADFIGGVGRLQRDRGAAAAEAF